MSTVVDPRRSNPAPRAPGAPTGKPGHTPLRVVAPRSATSPRAPFMAALVVLLVAGLVGLLLLNTAMQRRAFALTTLDQQADVLDTRAAALTMRTDRMASPQRLRLQAAELGMVPYDNPVFLNLADGTVLGDPVPASSAASIPGLLPPSPTVTEPQRRATDEPGIPDAPSGTGKPSAKTSDPQDGAQAGGRTGSLGDSKGHR